MQRSTQRILTTHAGSLPRPADLADLNAAKMRGDAYDDHARSARIPDAVTDVVRHQSEVGLDVINDGECSKTNFLAYAEDRLSGFERAESREGFFARRDWRKFESFYRDSSWGRRPGGTQAVCTGPIAYRGQALVKSDIDNLRAAVVKIQPPAELFLTAIAPGTFGRGQNRYYATEEAFLFAIGEAMREEYRAIVEAGLVLQIDDPGLPDTWDMLNPEPSLEEYRRFAQIRVDALNHGLAGLPEDRIRYHICWGSWPGPHVTDIALRDIVDLLLQVRAGAYYVEAANPRHEHEWRVWQDVHLPEGKVLIPGVVTHKTPVVEHPEVVADRLVRYAEVVGRENVIAGTDCGFGGRMDAQVAWAKLQAMVDGAALASQRLWRSSARSPGGLRTLS
ncbi:MAG: cobalamin-independent methionine synthase II family protein [Chloroflexi bacterium]|nr:cobalamin-independent methionine synthase II family protein [Chloroflexota bacterium]